MESGNSSSMQSSSGGCGVGGGGEEEYDSRIADQSISAFFDQHVSSLEMKRTTGFAAVTGIPQQNQYFQFDHNNNNNNSLLQPNYGFLPSDVPISQPDFRGTISAAATSSFPPPNNIGVIVTKKTKKRSRASRRAPTTVLTTDTSNFRAMVQEFTGIPSPPLFNVNNSVVNTTRLNTFLGLSSSSSSSINNNLLLRPFAHKLISSTTSNLLSATPQQIHQQQQQYNQNPNNGFENMNLQSLLQSSNPNRTNNDHFGLGMLQNPTTTTPPVTTSAAAVANGENASYGGSDQDHNNDGTWLCSSSDQRT